jgi:hypothetical protein
MTNPTREPRSRNTLDSQNNAEQIPIRGHFVMACS